MGLLLIFWAALTLGNAYWYYRRAVRAERSTRWKIGLAAFGGGLNVIVFLNFNKFIDGHMPRWFYRLVIKNELLAISLVMLAAAMVVCLIGLIFIRKKSTGSSDHFHGS